MNPGQENGEVRAGTRLGPYEILEPIGAGGMGEVYQARDTRLSRIVAIKVLPPRLAQNPESRDRFEREARTIASLNHPNICTLYDVGHQGDIEYLVMEYLEGETLASRLRKGALPLEQTLAYGMQIADALDKAHRKGVTHRDLKPGNVMLTKSGAKLLDFGLAKWKHGAAAPVASLSQIPTQTAPITAQGTILGTLQYMAPEQLEGKEADARADIFAFGAVLYEMATGRRAFEGQSQPSLMAKILESEPAPLRSLQPTAPASLERLVMACLAKDPEERVQSARDVRLELGWIRDAAEEPEGSKSEVRGWQVVLPWVIAAAAVVVGAFAWLRSGGARNAIEAQPVRFEIPLPTDTRFTASFTLSPDGRKLAFAAAGSDGIPRIWIRNLDSLEMHPLPGTESVGQLLIWSPDSRSIAFDSGGKLQKIEVSGGPTTTLCRLDSVAFSGSWNKDGVILLGAVGGPVMRVPAEGGTLAAATALDSAHGDVAHTNPIFLPDGRHFLYLRDEATNGAISVGSLDAKPEQQDSRRLVEGIYGPRYVPSAGGGRALLLFRRGQSLMSQQFDAESLTLSGEAFPALDAPMGVFFDSGLYSVAGNGMLAYRTPGNPESQLTWFDASGKILATIAPPAFYSSLTLSPDGAEAIVTKGTGLHSLWQIDTSSGASTPLANDATTDYAQSAAWSPDGRSMIYGPAHSGKMADLYKRPIDASGDGEELLRTDKWKVPLSWSPDGYLLYSVAGKGQELWELPVKDPTKAAPLLQGGSNYPDAQFSPDGRWVAYESNESSRDEIYVKSFVDDHLGVGGRVSPNGGFSPRWSKDGKQLYYVGLDYKLMKMNLTLGATVQPGTPVALFPVPRNLGPYKSWAPSPDGKRFLFLVTQQQQDTPITVVLNWQAGLKK